MTLLSPAWLLGLLLLPLLLFWPRPVWSAAGRTRDTAAVPVALLRVLCLALLCVALARPVGLVEDDRAVQVLVVDRSASVAADSEAAAGDLVEAWSEAGPVVRIDLAPDADRSALGAALARAALAIPAGRPGAVTLVSDGLATAQDFGPAAVQLAERGIPVHALELPSIHAAAPGGDPRPVALVGHGPGGDDVPLRVGLPALVDVTLADPPTDFDLVLSATTEDGEPLELAAARFALDPEQLAPGEPLRARLEFEPTAAMAGFLEVSLVLTRLGDDGARLAPAAGPLGANDSLRATLAVHGPRRVLHLGGRVQGSGAELTDLVGAGFELVEGDASLRARLAGPEAAALLASFDAVVLDDLSAELLGPAAAASLAAAVRGEGLGLFAMGGLGAFGPGGWHDTPIEDLLPVELVQKEEKRDPSTTLVVIIDTSGSMGGNRVQLAKEVARLAIRRLLPHDKVGLVEFYGAKRWAAPIQPASNAIEIERALNRLNAGGGTVILPAIEEAFYGLKNVRTRYKHVLILTDGGVETGAFEPLLRSMAEDGINTSTVLIGPDAHSEFLVTLANWGKGRFYSVPNRFNLPEILLKQPTTAKLPAWRPGPHRVRTRGGASWWPAGDSELPELGGYVETRLRPGAQVVVETAAEGHPVLASWELGLGRVSALTTEPAGAGTSAWSAWDGLGPLLARTLERTTRPSDAFRFSATRDGHEVLLRARHTGLGGGGRPAAALLGTEAPAPLAFERVAPGHFEARVTADPDLELRLALGPAGRGALVVPPAQAPELNVDPAAALDLEVLAAGTGGSHARLASLTAGLPVPAAGGADDPRRLRDLRPLLLGLALLTYLVEVLLRRLDRRAAPTPTARA